MELFSLEKIGMRRWLILEGSSGDEFVFVEMIGFLCGGGIAVSLICSHWINLFLSYPRTLLVPIVQLQQSQAEDTMPITVRDMQRKKSATLEWST